MTPNEPVREMTDELYIPFNKALLDRFLFCPIKFFDLIVGGNCFGLHTSRQVQLLADNKIVAMFHHFSPGSRPKSRAQTSADFERLLSCRAANVWVTIKPNHHIRSVKFVTQYFLDFERVDSGSYKRITNGSRRGHHETTRFDGIAQIVEQHRAKQTRFRR